MKRDLSPKGVSAGHPIVGCSRGDAAPVEIEADYSEGTGWARVAIGRRTPPTDLHARPPAGTARVSRCRVIFRHATQRIGRWNDAVSVAVARV